jgi:glutamyl-tRNA(Gln) amidotransferase subunit D
LGELHGYTGLVAEVLRRAGVKPGDVVRVRRGDGREFTGVLMPRYSLAEGPYLVIKLPNGYNIGVRVDESTVVEKVGEARREKPGEPVPLIEGKLAQPRERVMIVGAGGTVASRIDYETGAVKPYLSPEELSLSVPELWRYADVDAVQLFQLLSEDMKPSLWARLVEEVARAIERGYDGVVVTHGTDTMAFTASALAFAFHRGLPVPVVLTGAQRSSDRPSSDAAFNLTAAVLTAARAPFAEVVVVMHGETGDTYALAHRGVRVKKMHSSRRDAFQSVNASPLARVWPDEGRIEVLDGRFRRRGEQELVVENGFSERVALIKHFPGPIAEVIDALVDRGFKGIVIEGTGFGHVSNDAIKSLERAREEGVAVAVVTQTVFGRVNLNVYSTGRKMLAAGVIPLEDMTAEAAYAKLSWVLARAESLEEVRRMMLTNLAGEMSGRHSLRLYRHVYGG